MFGYPRRYQPSRRATPTATHFDPSGDTNCAFWVRADVNCEYNSQSQLVTNLTSRLPGQQVFGIANGGAQWWRVPQLSNGFDAIAGPPGSSFGVTNVGNGSRYTTTTLVMRSLAYVGAGGVFLNITNFLRFDSRYQMLRIIMPNAGSYADVVAYIWSTLGVNVITFRTFPYDEGSGNLYTRWTVDMNGSFIGTYPDTTGTANWGAWTMGSAETLTVSTMYHSALHEVIHWNRKLTDTEVANVHNLLAQQYALA
ncbi:hypothetical protein K2Z83_11270 [Oscillochloris sp. ZM17-4]|uniref:hypothetical protein n=1 Tax=Oscillochloris sp. ZM17-4 TaxID=2866714 RepID=UPI001C73D468|nr:hypothetical protein [Oscillochloris sp. ZM17-4]MBX0328256.1 hypothetical protein [Oscillochloris sp. ZM17-4]